MIDEPGSLAGKLISMSPARGPEPSHLMSFAILKRVTAVAFKAACARTTRSSVACAANLFGALTKGSPVSSVITAATSTSNPAGALRPVPTAVPPIASGNKPWVAYSTKSIASASAAAYPDHSCPTVSGVAS